MKARLYIIGTLLLTLACAGYWETAMPTVPKITPTLPIMPSSTLSASTVIAEKNLHLRDLPEELGGSVLTLMPGGSSMTVLYCRMIDGTVWAFGSYTDKDGKLWLGWAAARFLRGACDGT